ncbi:MAG: AzlC family ABC transporter permease [Thermomicrobiales bacterium]|nr:AzlC family ABC transporter permease [Thermomicrobiales bacterium]
MQDTTTQDHLPGDAGADDPPATFTLAGVRFGVITMLPLTVGSLAYGLVFGVLAGNVGLTAAEAAIMSGLVFTGAGQVAAMDLWAMPPPLLTIWLTTALVSLRYLVLGAALRPWLGQLRPVQAYGTLAVLIDQGWAMGLLEYRAGRRDAGYLLGGGLAMLVAWVVGTVGGYMLGNLVPDPAAWSLDFAATAIFVALIAGIWRGRSDAIPWLAAAVAAVAAHHLLAGPWYVPLGAVAGVLAGQIMERAGGARSVPDAQ